MLKIKEEKEKIKKEREVIDIKRLCNDDNWVVKQRKDLKTLLKTDKKTDNPRKLKQTSVLTINYFNI